MSAFPEDMRDMVLSKNGIIDLDGKTFLTKDPNIHIDYANKLAVFPRYPEEGMEVTVNVPEQVDSED